MTQRNGSLNPVKGNVPKQTSPDQKQGSVLGRSEPDESVPSEPSDPDTTPAVR